MSVISEINEAVFVEKQKEYLKSMIEKGMQIPLNKMLTTKQILSLKITEHVILRYKQRFEKLHDIQIEQEIRTILLHNATIVDTGHSNRWLVHAKGFIFVLDENTVYTTYDVKGNDRNNILDPTKAKLQAVNRKTKNINRIQKLFDLINNNNYGKLLLD